MRQQHTQIGRVKTNRVKNLLKQANLTYFYLILPHTILKPASLLKDIQGKYPQEVPCEQR